LFSSPRGFCAARVRLLLPLSLCGWTSRTATATIESAANPRPHSVPSYPSLPPPLSHTLTHFPSLYRFHCFPFSIFSAQALVFAWEHCACSSTHRGSGRLQLGRSGGPVGGRARSPLSLRRRFPFPASSVQPLPLCLVRPSLPLLPLSCALSATDSSSPPPFPGPSFSFFFLMSALGWRRPTRPILFEAQPLQPLQARPAGPTTGADRSGQRRPPPSGVSPPPHRFFLFSLLWLLSLS
jgi:hypothetical protein